MAAHATLQKIFPTFIAQSEPQGSHWHCYPEGLSILKTHPSAPNGPLSPHCKMLKAEEIEWKRAGSAKTQDTIDLNSVVMT